MPALPYSPNLTPPIPTDVGKRILMTLPGVGPLQLTAYHTWGSTPFPSPVLYIIARFRQSPREWIAFYWNNETHAVTLHRKNLTGPRTKALPATLHQLRMYLD